MDIFILGNLDNVEPWGYARIYGVYKVLLGAEAVKILTKSKGGVILNIRFE